MLKSFLAYSNNCLFWKSRNIVTVSQVHQGFGEPEVSGCYGRCRCGAGYAYDAVSIKPRPLPFEAGPERGLRYDVQRNSQSRWEGRQGLVSPSLAAASHRKTFGRCHWAQARVKSHNLRLCPCLRKEWKKS